MAVAKVQPLLLHVLAKLNCRPSCAGRRGGKKLLFISSISILFSSVAQAAVLRYLCAANAGSAFGILMLIRWQCHCRFSKCGVLSILLTDHQNLPRPLICIAFSKYYRDGIDNSLQGSSACLRDGKRCRQRIVRWTALSKNTPSKFSM